VLKKQQEREMVKSLDSDTVIPYYRETEERLYSQTVTQQSGETVGEFEKTSFYITAEQSSK